MLNPAPAARAVKPGVGARALYLGSREAKRVSCTAEALVVTNARAQTLRYPVARVARVVSSADVVDWSGTALALCMRAGIGITWLDARGHALGSLYPQHRTVAPLATALELWIENEDGLTRYHHWLRSRRMPVLVVLTKADKLSRQAALKAEKDVMEVIRDYAERYQKTARPPLSVSAGQSPRDLRMQRLEEEILDFVEKARSN